MDWALADSDRQLLSEAEKIHGMMQHRILNPGTVQAERFDSQRNAALDSFIRTIRE